MTAAKLLILIVALLTTGAPPTRSRELAREREAMVLAVANLADTAGIPSGRDLNARVLGAMRAVPRHMFVPAAMRPFAYENRPLPIGHEQTISQPYIVALMTHLLKVEPQHRVLEIGTGSGYQAAVLAHLASEVRSIEIVEPLARESAELLKRLGYDNVTVRAGDGYVGWPEQALFDRIIVTAGAPHVPQPLLDQLKPGGRMVIPVTRRPGLEELRLITKDKQGRIRNSFVTQVRFVPLTRAPG